ncbi:unnamed protein product [Cyclocybe aegerita]|uniref:DUF6534 domain-containing protein n=1 Tax=Cyclocybe aegerita TaxID=1973307 RepID=A0A8S0XH24_CYCAE|nr:unnamed protein product [Cyclocybe aegerita]
MNSTTSTAPSDHAPIDLDTTLGAAFFGFCAGAILFGITLRQAYQYYTTNLHDSILRKLIIAIVCLLDASHLVFSMYMVYSFIIQLLGYSEAEVKVLWSVKALATTQTILIVFVQGYYLSQIWRLSGNVLLGRKLAVAAQAFVIFIVLLAIVVAIIFLSQLQKVADILSFSAGFEYVVYLGFGTTALIDCAIAAAMCLLLHKSSAGTLRSETVLESLIQYFIGTGLLTSFAAIMVIVLYIARPRTLLYLGMEFSVTRLYANSILAMFNARQRLRGRFDESIEIKLPSNVFFGEPDSMAQSLIGAPFSPGSPTKVDKVLAVACVRVYL